MTTEQRWLYAKLQDDECNFFKDVLVVTLPDFVCSALFKIVACSISICGYCNDYPNPGPETSGLFGLQGLLPPKNSQALGWQSILDKGNGCRSLTIICQIPSGKPHMPTQIKQIFEAAQAEMPPTTRPRVNRQQIAHIKFPPQNEVWRKQVLTCTHTHSHALTCTHFNPFSTRVPAQTDPRNI